MSHSILKDENLQGRKKTIFTIFFVIKFFVQKSKTTNKTKNKTKKKTTLTTTMSMSSTLHLFNLLTDPEIQHGI